MIDTSTVFNQTMGVDSEGADPNLSTIVNVLYQSFLEWDTAHPDQDADFSAWIDDDGVVHCDVAVV